MYKYAEVLGRYNINQKRITERGELIGLCPFHEEENPSFNINLETGLYKCFSCGEQGNIIDFISNIESISITEAKEKVKEYIGIKKTYTLQEYSKEKNIPINYLEKIGITNEKDYIAIPYLDEKNNIIATRHRYNSNSKHKFLWKKGSKISLYGIPKLKEYKEDYIILVEGESDCHTLWYKNIQAIGVPGASTFNDVSAKYLEKFKKVYISNEEDTGGKVLIKSVCKLIPQDKIFLVSSKKINSKCKDPSDLHLAGIDVNKIFETAINIDREYYNEVNESSEKVSVEKPEIHVEIAEMIMKDIVIKYYNEDFYIYKDGVYKENKKLIEILILELKPSAKIHLRKEILDYIRIKVESPSLQIKENYINFKNGLFDLNTKKFIEHTPEYFTTIQLNVNFIEKNEIIENEYMNKFLDDISCFNINRKKAILQIIGYCMTLKVDMQKAFIFYRKKS